MINHIRRIINRIRGLEISAERARALLDSHGIDIQALDIPLVISDSFKDVHCYDLKFGNLRVVPVELGNLQVIPVSVLGRREMDTSCLMPVRVTGTLYATPKDTYSTLRPSSSHRAPETSYFPFNVVTLAQKR